MAHNIEMVGDVAKMAYAGETPWHGLGVQVPADVTPQQMLEAAGLDWEVRKIKAYAKVGGKNVEAARKRAPDPFTGFYETSFIGPDGALQLRHDPPLIWLHAVSVGETRVSQASSRATSSP